MPGRSAPDAVALLLAYASAHDEGTAGRGWDAVAALFAEDGVMRFEGIPAGPYEGRAAIRRGFETHGPTDRLVVDPPRALGTERATAPYRWTASW